MEESASAVALGWPWPLAAACACIIVVAAAVLRRRAVGPATLVWALPFAAVPAFFCVWCAQGLCQVGAPDFCAGQLTCAVFGVAVLFRENFARALKRLAEMHFAAHALPWIRDAAIIGVATWHSFAALEMADNPAWTAIEVALRDQALLIIGLAMVCAYFLGQRRGALCTVVVVVCVIFGLVQNFLDLFKNTALLPSDVMAWQTAASVSGGYTYILPKLAVECIISGMVAIAALAFALPIRARVLERGRKGREQAPESGGLDSSSQEPAAGKGPSAEAPHPSSKRTSGIPNGVRLVARVGINLAVAAWCAMAVYTNIVEVDYQEKFEVELDYWDLRNSYHESGFLISFIAAAQDLRIEEPPGYSEQEALRIQGELAKRYDDTRGAARSDLTGKFAKQPPSVIAIMNESYSDLSLFEQLHDDYTGTYVTQDLPGCSDEGWLAMSVHGGGTCNSEYEFLAFSSMGFLGSGMYPYQQFSFANALTLPSVFKKMGYDTWGMHPSYPGNWNREFVYVDMGIDKSLFVYDFGDAELFHDFVSDKATYQRALDILKDSKGPQFILDITMQNHGGYDTGTIPANQMTDYRPDFLDKAQVRDLNEYLSCVQESDEAVKYLIEQLSQMDRPVAVVFFGDHQPSISRDYNDLLFAGETELEHNARITKTPYFIWTNFDTGQGGKAAGEGRPKAAFADGSKTSVDSASSALFLGAQLLEDIGAPLDDYQKALIMLHEQVKAVNTNGYCDARGVWHDPRDDEAAQGADSPYRQLEFLHYLNVAKNY